MDSKKVLEKLLKIAENQQKIIMKLAQLPPDALPTGGATIGGGKEHQLGTEPPPQDLKPNPTQHTPAKAFYDAMSPQQKALLASAPEAQGNEMRIKFKGQPTQAGYDSLLSLLQNLTRQNKIQQAYNLKVV
jgi:hypothetical protein